MKKINNIFLGFGLSILLILLGIYIVNTNTTVFGKLIGYANIIFFSGLILWAIFKMYKNTKEK